MKLGQTLALTLCWLALGVHAQERWTLDRLLSQTLGKHPLVQEKRAAQAAAQADVDAAEWQRYPSPSVEATSASGQDQGGNILRIDQPLWTGGRITANIDLARARHEAASAVVSEVQLDLAYKVVAATSEVWRQTRRRQAQQATVQEHERLRDMIQRRVDQEVSSVADQRLANARLLAVRNDLSLTVLSLDTALLQLTQLAGEPVQTLVEQGLDSDASPPELALVVFEALSSSPTLRRLNMESRQAELDIDVRKAAYQPQLLLRYQNSRINGVNDQQGLLVLQAQPGAGLSAYSAVLASQARRDGARSAKEAAERDLRERATQLWREWASAHDRASNASEARSMAQDVSASYARQYTAGRKTWLDTLNAAREATQSELALIDNQSQALAARLKMLALMGQLPAQPPATPPKP